MSDLLERFAQHCLERHPAPLATQIFSFLHHKTADPAYLEGLARVAAAEEDPSRFNVLLWNVNRLLFTSRADLQDDVYRRIRYEILAPAYLQSLRRMEAWIGEVPTPAIEGSGDCVVIVSHAILGQLHAPSKMCLDVAHQLSVSGVETVVLNANALPTKPDPNFVAPFVSNINRGLMGDQVIEYRGRPLRVLSSTETGLAPDKVKRCVEQALSCKPTLILSQGDFNAIGDLLATRLPTVCLPTARHEPLSAAHGWVDFTGGVQGSELHRRGLVPHAPAISQFPALLLADAKAASRHRSSLGIPDDRFVFVIVGNRLSQDLTESFQQTLARILEAAPRADVLLVGPDPLPAPVDALSAMTGRLHFLDYDSDLAGLFGLCDAFLNPPRSGGGYSSAMAMAAGLPVLTVAGGDVAAIVGEALALPDADALERQAVRVATDAQAHAEWKRRIQAAHAEAPTMAQSMTKLLDLGRQAKRVWAQAASGAASAAPG